MKVIIISFWRADDWKQMYSCFMPISLYISLVLILNVTYINKFSLVLLWTGAIFTMISRLQYLTDGNQERDRVTHEKVMSSADLETRNLKSKLIYKLLHVGLNLYNLGIVSVEKRRSCRTLTLSLFRYTNSDKVLILFRLFFIWPAILFKTMRLNLLQ